MRGTSNPHDPKQPAPAATTGGNGPDRLTEPVETENPPRLPFPVVGIGASAGGLEAASEFFLALPADSGMAFVLVQHLPPERESLMAEILSKKAKIPVLEVKDGIKVERNHAYVIRPGHTLLIKDGRLHLGEPIDKPRHTRPVDDFFRSLAAEQRERAICIILSGMGSNGTQGSQEIKAVGGLCVAQDPVTAKFPSMPQHLIETGCADFIFRPSEMPALLQRYAAHPYALGRAVADAELQRDRQHLLEILAILRNRTRHDFTGYKKPTVLRRIQRRMSLNQLTQLDHYVKHLRQHPAEVSMLSDDLMIHVTGFFRDAPAWEALRQQVIVPLVNSRESDSPIRCWVTACSSGEEAYTLGMLLVEAAEQAQKTFDIKIFATDTADRTLGFARAGLYPGGIEGEITPQRLERFFERHDAMYRVKKDLRERVVFAPQNVIQDPPFSRLDIVTCRNLLIYLEPDLQRRVLGVLHFGLRDNGALFLGTSETVTGSEDLFTPVDQRWRIFRRIGPTRHNVVKFETVRDLHVAQGGLEPPKLLNRGTVAQMTNRLLLERFTPAAVTVDREFRVQYFHGETEWFLAQPRGEPTRELMELVREPLRGAVRTALHNAIAANEPATVRDGVMETRGGPRRIEVTAAPLSAGATDFFVVTFTPREEPPPPPPAKPHTAPESIARDAELQRVRDELQTTIEELQTSNEEMKAAHEESMSVNEELQSANEELETSKEELQSLNEELNTVNAQLATKMEELEATSNDLASLLASTDIAVVFLDTQMKIRRFTPAASDLMQFIPADIGRPLSDLAQKFIDPNLLRDAKAVLEKLVPLQAEVTASSGRTYLRRVTPYRTLDNRINGVVVTFVDVTGRRRAETDLSDFRERFRTILDQLPVGIVLAEPSGTITLANQAVAKIFRSTAAPAQRIDEFQQWQPRHLDGRRYRLDEYPMLRVLQEGTPIAAELMRFRRADGEDVLLSVSAVGIRDNDGKIIAGVVALVDITGAALAQTELEETEARHRLVIDSMPVGVVFVDADQVIKMANPEAQRILGRDEKDLNGKKIEAGAHIVNAGGVEVPANQMPVAVAMATGKPVSNVVLGLKHLKGQTRWVSINVVPLIEPRGGRPYGAVCSFVDITASRAQEAERDALLEREQDALRAAQEATRHRDLFLSTVSHELRTPLAVINIWAKMLRGPNVTPEQVREGIEAIDQSAETQKRLIDDLLDTARVQSGKLRLERRPMTVAPVVKDALEAILPTAEAKDLKVRTTFTDGSGVVSADPERLRQVVWNLLTNAVKFTPQGGTIDVGVSREADIVVIKVADNGRGIEPQFLTRMFVPFTQSDSTASRPQAGLGLGLAISKQLAELHGGTIEAHSGGPGKGSTFTVRLPLPLLSKKEFGKTEPESGARRPTLKGVSILLVEDEAQTRYAVTTALQHEGAVVTPVGSAAKGVAAFTAKRPALIVSDIGLPGEDGFAFIERVRRLEEEKQSGPRVPALALTAFTRDEEHRRALSAGFDLHLGKPIDPAQLVSALVGLLATTR